MKTFATVSSAVLLSALASNVALADPGLHVHPHVVDGLLSYPLVTIHPALALAGVVAFWAASVWSIERLGAALRRARLGFGG